MHIWHMMTWKQDDIIPRYFAWLPIIRSDNMQTYIIFWNKGMAENHFHLNGSTKIFELNWLMFDESYFK